MVCNGEMVQTVLFGKSIYIYIYILHKGDRHAVIRRVYQLWNRDVVVRRG